MCNYGITNEQFLGFFPPTFLLSNMVTSIGKVSIKYCLQITYRLTINIKMITSVTDYYHNVSNFYCILSALSTESKCSTCEATAIIVIQSGPWNKKHFFSFSLFLRGGVPSPNFLNFLWFYGNFIQLTIFMIFKFYTWPILQYNNP